MSSPLSPVPATPRPSNAEDLLEELFAEDGVYTASAGSAGAEERGERAEGPVAAPHAAHSAMSEEGRGVASPSPTCVLIPCALPQL